MAELLNCPWCGRTPTIDRFEFGGHPFSEVRCCLSKTGRRWPESEAIAAWNRRTPPPQAAGGEPVAWLSQGGDVSRSADYFREMGFREPYTPLYDHPPAVGQEWAIPSKQECYDIWMKTDRDHSMFSEHLWRFARQLLADMKEKTNDPS